MTFKDYFLCEAYIGELVSKYSSINQGAIESWSHKMYDYCISWAVKEYYDGKNNKLYKQYDKEMWILFKEVEKYRPFAIQALRDLHELEYKQSQLKKFYSKPEVLAQLNITLFKIAKWLKEYLSVVLFSRACGDSLEFDNDRNLISTNYNMDAVLKRISQSGRDYNEYVVPVFIELYNAKSLSQMLIAISKAKNAEHDGGKIMTDWGTGLFRGNEKAFDEISNLNYRKLDRELQQELS